MAGLTWYQFSDLHFRDRPDFDRSIVLSALQRDIPAQLDKGLVPDFICVTGDIAWSGQEQEYRIAETEFFLPLLDQIGLPRDKLFIVPGNHDVDRSALEVLNCAPLAALDSRDKVNRFIGDSKTLARYLIGFEAYDSFVRSLTGQANSGLGWKHSTTVKGTRVSLLGLNTAWMSGYSGIPGWREDEQGHLIVGERQLLPLLPDAEEADLVLALMHHPLSWLSDHDKAAIEQTLADRCDIVMHGHVHRPTEISSIAAVSGGYLSLGAGASYERRVGTEPFVNCYSLVDFQGDTREATVSVRKYTDTPRPRWTSHNDLFGEGSNGSRVFSIPSSRGSAQQPTGKPPSVIFRSIEDVIRPLAAKRASRLPRRLLRGASSRTSIVSVYDDVIIAWANSAGLKPSVPMASSVFVTRAVLLTWEESGRSNDVDVVDRAFDEICAALGGDVVLSIIDQCRRCWARMVHRFDEPLIDTTEGEFVQSYPEALASVYLGLSLLLLSDLRLAESVIKRDLPINDAEGLVVDPPGPRAGRVTDSIVFLSIAAPTLAEFAAVSVVRHYLDQRLQEFADELSAVDATLPLAAIAIHFISRPKEWTEHRFSVDPGRVLRLLMGDALYGAKSEDVWFREVLQNAIDATAARARLATPGEQYERLVEFRYDHTSKQVRITDNGVGMTRDHIFRFFCRAGRSIWRSEELEAAQEEHTPVRQSLGKFGVGFLSVFQVAAKVNVATSFFKNPDGKGYGISISGLEEPFFLTDLQNQQPGTTITLRFGAGYHIDRSKLIQRYIAYLPAEVKMVGLAGIPETAAAALDDMVAQTLRGGDVPKRRLRWEKVHFKVEELGASLHVAVPLNPSLGEGLAHDRFRHIYEHRLKVSNGGIAVTSQDSLWLGEDGKSRRTPGSDMNGVHALLDFPPGSAPVTVSRTALTLTDEDAEHLLGRIREAVIAAWRSFAQADSDQSDKELATRRLMKGMGSTCDAAAWDRNRWSEDYTLERGAREILIEWGMVYVHDGGIVDSPILMSVREILETGKVVHVLSNAQRGNALIQLYASKCTEFTGVFVGTERDVTLLASCGATWRPLASTDDLWSAMAIEEDRSWSLNSWIPADVAIVEQDYFEDKEEIFLLLPTKRARAEFVEGLSRADVKDVRPRVLLNAAHPDVVRLESLTSKGTLGTRIRECFDFLVAGVVEEKAKGRRDRRRKEVLRRIQELAKQSPSV
jgi:hypothetical protein